MQAFQIFCLLSLLYAFNFDQKICSLTHIPLYFPANQQLFSSVALPVSVHFSPHNTFWKLPRACVFQKILSSLWASSQEVGEGHIKDCFQLVTILLLNIRGFLKVNIGSKYSKFCRFHSNTCTSKFSQLRGVITQINKRGSETLFSF